MLTDHIEKYFGRISRGWLFKDDGYSIVECRNGQIPGVISYCTLGLSKYELGQKRSKNNILLELIMGFDEKYVPKNIVGIVSQICSKIISTRQAPSQDQLIERPEFIFDERGFTTIWVKSPVMYEDEASSYEGEDIIGECFFAWLIPLFPSERDFIYENGGSAFEDLLLNNGVDFFDLDRSPVVTTN